jgi:hypothetical protein
MSIVPIILGAVATPRCNRDISRLFTWLFKYQHTTELNRDMLVEFIEIYNDTTVSIYYIANAIIVWCAWGAIWLVCACYISYRTIITLPQEVALLKAEVIRSSRGITFDSNPPTSPPSSSALGHTDDAALDEPDTFGNFITFPPVNAAGLAPLYRRAKEKEQLDYLETLYTTTVLIDGKYVAEQAHRANG